MRYVISTIAALTLASAVGVFAQEQQAPAQPPAGDQAPAQLGRKSAQIDTHRLCGAGEDN